MSTRKIIVVRKGVEWENLNRTYKLGVEQKKTF
jgi:hypothetical protein